MNLRLIEKQVELELSARRNMNNIISDHEFDMLFKDKEAKETYESYQQALIDYSKADYNSNEEKKKELKELLINLKEKMQLMLKKSGVDVDKLKHKYVCDKCKDLGFVDGKMCSCYKEILSSKLLEASGLNKMVLPTFSSVAYNSIFDLTQREKLKKVCDLLQTFCNKINTTKINTLLLSGQVGVGKTYLMQCVINELINQGKFVLYQTAFGFNKNLLEIHCGSPEEQTLKLAEFIDCDVLCIDDLGTENITKNVTIEYLYSIINERNILGKKTIITTNLDIDQINEKYGERISSRLTDKSSSVKIEMKGDDLRKIIIK